MDPNFEIANRGKRPLMVHSDLLWHQMQVEVAVVVVAVVVVVVVVAVVVLPNGSSQSMTCHYPLQHGFAENGQIFASTEIMISH